MLATIDLRLSPDGPCLRAINSVRWNGDDGVDGDDGVSSVYDTDVAVELLVAAEMAADAAPCSLDDVPLRCLGGVMPAFLVASEAPVAAASSSSLVASKASRDAISVMSGSGGVVVVTVARGDPSGCC